MLTPSTSLFALVPIAVLLTLSLGGVAAADPCADCHRQSTPALVATWEASRHAGHDVTCTVCHGADHEAIVAAQGAVPAARCGECHSAPLAQHRKGKHGIGLRAGTACTRNVARPGTPAGDCLRCHEAGSMERRVAAECAQFLTQSPEMQQEGCLACHRVEDRCDTCHTKHATDLAIARAPETCGRCHLGPDHHQYEMWAASLHGTLYRTAGPEAGPACTTCHMAEGSHDVSRGISMGLGGEPYPEGQRLAERQRMVAICSRCHTPRFATDQLARGDAIQRQSLALVEEAEGIIAALHADGLLTPSPEGRPPHPLSGHRLVLGAQMLYEDLSPIEALFFRMKKFHYVTAYKGAFHQSPDYAHWYGNVPLKLTLAEIRGAAQGLRRAAALHRAVAPGPHPSAGTPLYDQLRESILALQKMAADGLLTPEEYQARLAALLDRAGL